MFDFVLSAWAMFDSSYMKFETDERMITMLREVRRVLKPGSRFRTMSLVGRDMARLKKLANSVGGLQATNWNPRSVYEIVGLNADVGRVIDARDLEGRVNHN